jgi:hypothetical protein
VIDWNVLSVSGSGEEVVRVVLGTFVSGGRLKKEGEGEGREVARKVTCRWM